MDDAEIRRSARLEQRHWWYAGRRALIRRLMREVPVGVGLDVGSGPGGNTAALRDLGWRMTAVEYAGVAAGLTHERRIATVRGDARRLPFADAAFDLVMSTDTWEHVDDDAAAAAEAFRVCRPGGRLLVACPASMALWSGHDGALGHHRRYERDELVRLVESAGFVVHDVRSWNVLLRPIARVRRSRHVVARSEMAPVTPPVNAALRGVVAAEALLPVHRLPGISLVVRAFRP